MKNVPERLADKWVTLSDACEILQMSRTTVWRKVQADLLETEPYCGQTLVLKASIDRYLSRYTRALG